jgi:hypothetical protein
MRCEMCGIDLSGSSSATTCSSCQAEIRRSREGGDESEAERLIDGDAQQLPSQSLNNDMIVGGLIFVAGLIFTGVSYMNPSGGGTYIVTWGAIICGFIQFMRGLLRRIGMLC